VLFRAQIAIVYTFAGLAKANRDWLVHAQPLRIWIASKTDTPVLGPLFALDATPLVMSWAGFLFDTTIVWFLLWRRTRVAAYLAVLAFHAMTKVLFPIGMFPIIMVVSATVFFDATWPARIVAQIPRIRPLANEMHATPWISPLGAWQRIAMLAFVAMQLALPLRYAIYGGNVLWHEQGMRFSWRVMAREKNGAVTFVVRDATRGTERHVRPSQYLTAHQEREMSTQPDLILQLAKHIAREHGGSVEIYADAVASLNGRPAVALIDPSVDLARVPDRLAAATWIAPAPTGSPPHTRAAAAHASSHTVSVR